MKYELKAIADLIPNPKNARTHSKAQIEKIAASIKEFQFMNPVIIDSAGNIIAGHGRVEAAKSLDMDQVPCLLADHLTAKQKKAYILADNRLALDAGWDEDLLRVELEELLADGFDLGLTGFDENELEDLFGAREDGLTDEDKVPPIPVEPVSQLGDVWILGDHRLMCGDSTSIDAVEILINGDVIDLCYTDPPYGINEKGDRSNRGGLDKNKLAKAKKYDDFIDDSISYAIDAYNIVEGILKIPRQVWWGANYYCHSLPLSNNWFVWDKRVDDKQKDTQSDCELAWVKSKWSSVRIFRHLWKGMMKDSERGSARVHPTQKPVALAEWAFDYFKQVGSVLDLFGGSGSTLIACEKTSRKAYLMELDPIYVDVIIRRFEQFTGKSATLEATGKKFLQVEKLRKK
jgi:DNA modification methylase